MSNTGFQSFSMGSGDEGVLGGGKSKRWKGETGHTYRFSLLWFPGLEEGKLQIGTADEPAAPKFIGAPISYIPGVGFVVNNGPEITKMAGGEPPKTKVATVIAVWPLKKDGSPDGGRIQSGDTEIASFVFSGEKYNTLKGINREFPFALHDLTVKCEDAQYQKLTFTPCRESLLQKFISKGDSFKEVLDSVLAEGAAVASNIQNDLGRVMTVEQIRAKLMGNTGGPATTVAGAGAGPVSVTTETIDNLVDDLLS